MWGDAGSISTHMLSTFGSLIGTMRLTICTKSSSTRIPRTLSSTFMSLSTRWMGIAQIIVMTHCRASSLASPTTLRKHRHRSFSRLPPTRFSQRQQPRRRIPRQVVMTSKRQVVGDGQQLVRAHSRPMNPPLQQGSPRVLAQTSSAMCGYLSTRHPSTMPMSLWHVRASR